MRAPLSLLLVLVLAAAAQARSFDDVIMNEWRAFKFSYGKVYANDAEESFRLKVFVDNKQVIAKHNQLYGQGLSSFSLAMNQYGDLLNHEIVSMLNGHIKSDKSIQGANFMEPDDDVVMPDAVDWRQKGAVTPVKDQGQCGSCWAFSTTGSLEGQHFRKTGKLVSLSEQNLVDCSKSFGNHGCFGGLMDFAFTYIKSNDGIDTEMSYPYLAVDGTCNFQRDNVGADDTGFVDIETKNENALKKAVATVGPISVAIDASQSTFHFYHSGIYSDPNCSQTFLDHGVLAVGYGSEDDKDFWIVKNSWNATWGDNGYLKLARNQDNMCGIATQASYPLV